MAEFLTTNGTSFQIENIILDAKKKLVLISPYLRISKTFYERLKDASERGVEITLIYGKDELASQEKKSLSELNNLKLYFFKNLHAKCYLNESKMVITSMNMYEFSEKNNREMGVLVQKADDEKLFQKAVDEAHSIMKSSELKVLYEEVNMEKENKFSPNLKMLYPSSGYCIRCGEAIPYNIEKPFCRQCFSLWIVYENVNYPEMYCHACGKKRETSMNAPDCYSCYIRYEKNKF